MSEEILKLENAELKEENAKLKEQIAKLMDKIGGMKTENHQVSQSKFKIHFMNEKSKRIFKFIFITYCLFLNN